MTTGIVSGPPSRHSPTDACAAPSGVAAPGAERHRGAPAAVRLQGITKRYVARRSLWSAMRRPRAVTHITALHDVSLEVPAGSCFGLLGPNGAGKTTLFRILSTLVTPDAGEATVCGHDVADEGAAVRRRLASASIDERSLFWRLSAPENLRLYASLHGLRGAERRTRVDEALAAVGLTEAGGKLVGQFSSGMRHRLLVARALVARPAVLLLDEPTRALDPVSARDFRRFLREEIVGRRGATVLLATHNSEEAFELCDRVAVLHRGAVVAEGVATALAAELTDGRLELWTAPASLATVVAVVGELGGRLLASTPTEEAAWTRASLQLHGGAAAAAALTGRLGAAGVPVARLEAARPSLAELLERLVQRHEQPAGHAPTREVPHA